LALFSNTYLAYGFNDTERIADGKPELPVTTLPGLPEQTGPMLPPCYPDQDTQIYDSATSQCIPIPNGFEPCPTELVYSSVSGRCELPAPAPEGAEKDNVQPPDQEKDMPP
jgi:hypothetical protein